MPDRRKPQQPDTLDDEISLLELWQILVKQRSVVLLCMVLCIAAGAALAFLTPPVYEARTKLRIGEIAGVGTLESAEELSSRVIALHGEYVADGVRRSRPFVKSASPQRGVTTTIDLVVEADTPAQAVETLTLVVEGLRAQHEATFEQHKALLNERLTTLDYQRVALEQQFNEAGELMELLKETDPVQASLIMMERGRISATIRALEAEKPQLMQKLTAPQTRPTELLGDIAAPSSAASPRKGLILALSAVLGVMGGVMLVFVVEFVSKARSDGNADHAREIRFNDASHS